MRKQQPNSTLLRSSNGACKLNARLCIGRERRTYAQLCSIRDRLDHRADRHVDAPAVAVCQRHLYRTVDREHPTLIIDEADDLFYRKSDLRAIVNAGWKSWHEDSAAGALVRSVLPENARHPGHD